MRRNIAVTLCLFLASAAALSGQETFFSEVLEVRVTNVDVIVTGRDGKPVTGLTRDDFELYENGVKKEISNFLELRGDGAPAPSGTISPPTTVAAEHDIRRRDITIFIDNAVLLPNRRNLILPHLQRFIEENVRGGDTVAIVTWGKSLKLALEPTSDRAAVAASIQQLAGQSSFEEARADREEFYQRIEFMIRAHASRDEKPRWFDAINEARTYAMTRVHEQKQRMEAIKSIAAWRRGVDGRKILVMLTEEFPLNPAEDVFHYLNARQGDFQDARDAMMDAREYDDPTIVEQISNAANSAGVTLYPIQLAGKESNMPERDAASKPRWGNTGVVEAVRLVPILPTLALATGGVSMTGTDNWKMVFDTISNDLESYYSLGYRSEGERQDQMKQIEVKLKNKRYNVRTRKAVIERSVTSEMHDAVAANLFRPSATNDLAIKAAVGAAAPKDPEAITYPVTVTIPMDKLTLVPEGSDLTGRFALYAAFVRKDGAVSKVAQQPGAVRFPAESLKRRKELTVKFDVTTDPETNGISVGVMDEMSRVTGFTSVKLQ
jgi:VWFA-related protein